MRKKILPPMLAVFFCLCGIKASAMQIFIKVEVNCLRLFFQITFSPFFYFGIFRRVFLAVKGENFIQTGI